MAMIDKCTHMKRCAIIDDGNGAILYEGVLIEGYFLLQDVRGYGLYRIAEHDIMNYFCLDNGYNPRNLLVFMDDNDDLWCPREQENQIEFDDYFGRYNYVEGLDE